MEHSSQDLAAKLDKLLNEGELVVFSRDEALKLRVLANAPPGSMLDKEEVDEIRRMLTVSRGVEGLGFLMHGLRNILFWIGLAVMWTLWVKGKISLSDISWFSK